MELKEFINEALSNIVDGVDKANSKHKNRFRIIGIHHGRTATEGTYAEFDVSVVVQNDSGGKVGGKTGINVLNVVSVDIGAENNENASFQNTHRLKFKIFICEK